MCVLHETSLYQSPSKSHFYAPPPPICNCTHCNHDNHCSTHSPLSHLFTTTRRPLTVHSLSLTARRPLRSRRPPSPGPSHPQTLSGCIPLTDRARYELSSTRYINARIITSNGDSSRRMTVLLIHLHLAISIPSPYMAYQYPFKPLRRPPCPLRCIEMAKRWSTRLLLSSLSSHSPGPSAKYWSLAAQVVSDSQGFAGGRLRSPFLYPLNHASTAS